MIEVKGMANISAKVLCDSVSEAGVRIITFVLEYPRIVHSELMTHRVFSRNAASSRAIPFEKMMQQLQGIPVRFGKNQSGMQDAGEHKAIVLGWPVEHDGNTGAPAWTPEEAWNEAREHAMFFAEAFADAGYHKQISGRLTEPFSMMKTVVTATEWDNWFWLRNDDAADPTIAEVARCMADAAKQSEPQELKQGEWHLPYIDYDMDHNGKQFFYLESISDDGQYQQQILTTEEAIKVSCARCAAVSYKNEGYGLEKSVAMYERLVGGDKKHSSALEHCASPMQPYTYEFGGPNACTTKHINNPEKAHTWESGVSHADRGGNLWSGNFKGWIQYRKLVPGECYTALAQDS